MKRWIWLLVLGILGYAVYAWAFTPGRDVQPVSGTITSTPSGTQNVNIVESGVGTDTALKVDGSAVTQPVSDNSGSLTVDTGGDTPLYVRQSTSGGWSVTGNATSDTTLTITKAASAGHTWMPQVVVIASYAKCKWQVEINDVVVWRGLSPADAIGQTSFILPPLAGADNQKVDLEIQTFDGSSSLWIDGSLGGIE